MSAKIKISKYPIFAIPSTIKNLPKTFKLTRKTSGLLFWKFDETLQCDIVDSHDEHPIML